jgi:hypothetical protein
MPSLALVEAVERLPSLYSESCGSIAGPCATMETSSLFRLVIRPSTALVTYLHASLLLGATTPMIETMGSS